MWNDCFLCVHSLVAHGETSILTFVPSARLLYLAGCGSGKFLKIHKFIFKLSAHLSLSLQTAVMCMIAAESMANVGKLAIYSFLSVPEPLFLMQGAEDIG